MTTATEQNADLRQPHDTAAEQTILGCMMGTKDAPDQVIDIIHNSADFYTPAHSTIYSTIIAALAANEPTDPTVILSYLQRTGDLARIPGGATYLTDLYANVPVSASVSWYARRVADLATRRRVIAAGLRIVQQATDPSTDITAVADDAQQSIHVATTGQQSSTAVTLAEILGPTLDDIYSGQKPQGCVTTGLLDLDQLIGGLHPGQLTVVGARPGMGKTVLGMDFIRAAAAGNAMDGVPSMIFTLEMSRSEIVGRILAAECAVDLTRITNRTVDEHDVQRIEARRARLLQTPIIIDDDPTITIASLRAKARRAVQRHGVGLIVVDYLQLMSAGRRSESRQQDVADISRGLKLLAKELHIPVVACSQLNRGSEGRTDKRPQLSDLRETGAIEQDADVVILLHRDDYYDRESSRAGEIDVIIAKNRFGPQETVTCVAQLNLARIVNMGRG